MNQREQNDKHNRTTEEAHFFPFRCTQILARQASGRHEEILASKLLVVLLYIKEEQFDKNIASDL